MLALITSLMICAMQLGGPYEGLKGFALLSASGGDLTELTEAVARSLPLISETNNSAVGLIKVSVDEVYRSADTVFVMVKVSALRWFQLVNQEFVLAEVFSCSAPVVSPRVSLKFRKQEALDGCIKDVLDNILTTAKELETA